ncbi:MAG: glyoxalase [Cytophagales bacterium]|nr:glyoxalase [Cytophagales bacterium]
MKEPKVSIRPEIPSAKITEHISETEHFQNQVLRPIIKLQHDLLIMMFKTTFKQKKGVFFNLPEENKKGYLEQILLKDVNFVHQLRGAIIGLFTVEEYTIYLQNNSEFNRRIITMIKEKVLRHF